MIRSRCLLLVGLSLVVLGFGWAAAEAPLPGDGTTQVRVFELKHLATKEAGLVLRTIFEAGRIAELPDRGVLIIADLPARLDAMGKLLEKIDQPVARARLAASAESRGQQP